MDDLIMNGSGPLPALGGIILGKAPLACLNLKYPLPWEGLANMAF